MGLDEIQLMPLSSLQDSMLMGLLYCHYWRLKGSLILRICSKTIFWDVKQSFG